jgi:hypothetical protein
MSMYEVLFKDAKTATKREIPSASGGATTIREWKLVDAWCPKGEAFECSREDAMQRFAHLYELACLGAQLEGAIIEHVAIVTADKSQVMLSAWRGEQPTGPWAPHIGDA